MILYCHMHQGVFPLFNISLDDQGLDELNGIKHSEMTMVLGMNTERIFFDDSEK